MVYINKQNTHTHTHTHTHTKHSEKEKHWKTLVSMKISDTPLFKNNPSPPILLTPTFLPFYGKNLNPS